MRLAACMDLSLQTPPAASLEWQDILVSKHCKLLPIGFNPQPSSYTSKNYMMPASSRVRILQQHLIAHKSKVYNLLQSKMQLQTAKSTEIRSTLTTTSTNPSSQRSTTMHSTCFSCAKLILIDVIVYLGTSL